MRFAPNTPAPKHSRIHRSIPRLAMVAGMLAICLGATSKSCQLIIDNIDNRDNLSFVTSLVLQDINGLQTDTFRVGAPIQFVLTVRNELNTTATVEFPTTRNSDFVVVRDGTADVVWQWSDGKSFAQRTTVLTFAPGETKTFTPQIWNQVGRNGQTTPGTYQARGVLVFDGFDTDPLRETQLGSALVRFRIIN